MADLDPRSYAETAHLLLDLVSCPFLANTEKDTLIKAAMRHKHPNVNPTAIAVFRNFVSHRTWYFNWKPAAPTALRPALERGGDGDNPDYNLARHEMLHTHLLKKQLLLAY